MVCALFVSTEQKYGITTLLMSETLHLLETSRKIFKNYFWSLIAQKCEYACSVREFLKYYGHFALLVHRFPLAALVSLLGRYIIRIQFLRTILDKFSSVTAKGRVPEYSVINLLHQDFIPQLMTNPGNLYRGVSLDQFSKTR